MPIFFEMWDKKENSNSQERIELLAQFVDLFGKEQILSLTCDREFIGYKWLNWLIDNPIDFAILFPCCHQITLRNGQICHPADLVTQKPKRYFQQVILDGIRVNAALKKLDNDWLNVAGPLPVKKLFAHYSTRWRIKTFPKDSKSGVFIWRRQI